MIAKQVESRDDLARSRKNGPFRPATQPERRLQLVPAAPRVTTWKSGGSAPRYAKGNLSGFRERVRTAGNRNVVNNVEERPFQGRVSARK